MSEQSILNTNIVAEKPSAEESQPLLQDEVIKIKEPGKIKFWIWFLAFAVVAAALATVWFSNELFRDFVENIEPTFYYFLAAGFVFAMIDGAIGMSYGVTSTSFSLSMGIPPASASTAVHLSEILSCGIAGWMHKRMGNINKRLFWLLIVPGIIGAVTGAYLLSSLEHYSTYTKPVVSVYTLILGWVILSKAINLKKKTHKQKKIKNIRLLGFGGGFIDAVGGGGWGSIVLSSLIAGARNPRTSLGTVKATRFFIAILSSLTFVTMLKTIHWDAVAGLVIGSAIASPIAAKVSNRISAKTIMVAVGFIVILVSLKSIYTFITKLPI
ncbi:TSUP family transporter [Pedobacter sp. HMF7647]|uniref:Probable membrane transporter protein n=1 Tax=Hufsiella arboris TaxID=2695275 RepID=A0A7K1Y870_9SPHI|nr:sulfite exporter TauE/SafE family protein [Hufsiella arboris]MXV50794.1 TSUP family transporter [Hufsiella arboris]